MNFDVLLRPQAELDLDDAYHWYEIRREGLGIDFTLQVDEILHRLERNPEMYPVVHGEIRRAVVRRYPYAIYYVVDAGRVEILAIVHSSRNPRAWQSRL